MENTLRRSTRKKTPVAKPKPTTPKKVVKRRSISPRRPTPRTNKRGVSQKLTFAGEQVKRISPSYGKNRYWPSGYQVDSIEENEKTCINFVMWKFGIWSREDLTKAAELSAKDKNVIDICLRLIDKEKVTKQEKTLVNEYAIKHEDFRNALRTTRVEESNKELRK
jgi:hypothetical protein